MHRQSALAGFGFFAVLGLGGCSSDSKTPNEGPSSGGSAGASGSSGADAGVATGGSSSGPDGALPAAEPFNGDCKTAKWAHLSDECWACLCTACEPKLDLCKEGCTGIFECAQKKQTLVNVGSDLGCEIRATGAACIQDPVSQAQTQQLLDLDGCLLGAKKDPGEFRVCDTVCKTPYPGDVCERFPAAPAM
jgi:hypothetical protein